MEYTIIHNAKPFFEIRTSKEACLEDFVDMTNDLLGHPEWAPDTPLLIDHRALELETFTTDSIGELLRLLEPRSAEFGMPRCAIVVSKAFDFGLSRMWQILSEEEMGWYIRLFYSYDEAKDWITS